MECAPLSDTLPQEAAVHRFDYFNDLFPELQLEVAIAADPSTRMCLALTCKRLYYSSVRPRMPWHDFAAAILLANHEAQYDFARTELGISEDRFLYASGRAVAAPGPLGRIIKTKVRGMSMRWHERLPTQAVAEAVAEAVARLCGASYLTDGEMDDKIALRCYHEDDTKWTHLVNLGSEATIEMLTLATVAHCKRPLAGASRAFGYVDRQFLVLAMAFDAAAVERYLAIPRTDSSIVRELIYESALLAGHAQLLDTLTGTGAPRGGVRDHYHCALLEPTLRSLDWLLAQSDSQWYAPTWMWGSLGHFSSAQLREVNNGPWTRFVSPGFSMTALRAGLEQRKLAFDAFCFAEAARWLDLATVEWIAAQSAEALLAIDWRAALPRYGWARLSASDKHRVIGLTIVALEAADANHVYLYGSGRFVVLGIAPELSASQHTRLAALLSRNTRAGELLASMLADVQLIHSDDYVDEPTWMSMKDYRFDNRHEALVTVSDMKRLVALVPGYFTSDHFMSLLIANGTHGEAVVEHIRIGLGRSDLPEQGCYHVFIAKTLTKLLDKPRFATKYDVTAWIAANKTLVQVMAYGLHALGYTPRPDVLSNLASALKKTMTLVPDDIGPIFETFFEHFGTLLPAVAIHTLFGACT